ncbi:uncharacterized protein SPPG_04894 [Spizellomyces punctatus DAOM BR117]|uniref:F-box domain-containing protein n=1 Tax=Spizellomyces punctatus (strain DAOM BR117) TaxID=645134 RepID=A0A0L0HET4_SPIPD|nr:hypothetical protein, variant [Spizellomyces punctatus DAOM BR117]XP_016607540.1 uncharacterized protein SPPG_04894 [Spizellomyces punctatus DAOM BR117]KNC99499.1 hypothetical protein, variant [Spizellomyces punctatus DAOM BR117]KNC99500.1 hypothetical protein SPPG_04894 [Spizellomyces punctatus DAOM BR117]|eukprot:XP_016607539.1 hypothetical protein, variant [Spizellomyces punctatus DAOM BR117]
MASHAHLCCLCGCPVADIYRDIQECEELDNDGFNSLRHGDGTWFKWGVALLSNMMSYPGMVDGHVLMVHEIYGGDIPEATYGPVYLPDFEDAAEDSDEDTPVGPFSTSGDAEYTGLDYLSGSAVIVHHRCLSLAVEWTNSESISDFFMSPTGSLLECSCMGRNIAYRDNTEDIVNNENKEEYDEHREHHFRNRRTKEASIAAVDSFGSLSVDYEAFERGRDWPRFMNDDDYRPENAWLLTRPDRFPELPLVATKCTPGVEQRQQHRSDDLARLPMEIILAILEFLISDERSFLHLQSASHFWRSFLVGDTGLLPQGVQALYRKRCAALAWVPTAVDVNRRAKQFDAVLDTGEPIDWKSYHIACSRSPSMRNRNRMYRKMCDVYDLIHGGEGRRRVYNAFVKRMWARGYGEDQFQMI